MKQATLESCRRNLEQLLERVGSDADNLLEQTRAGSGGQAGGDLSNAPMHLGDTGTDEFMYDMNTALLANEQFIVAEARDALRRIDGGLYGKCDGCGKSIAAAR